MQLTKLFKHSFATFFVTLNLCFLQACGDNGEQLENTASTADAGTASDGNAGAASPQPTPSPSSGDESAPPVVQGDAVTALNTGLPAIPTPPADARKVTEFGAKPNDGVDDSAAIQKAIDSLGHGEWLVFPPGTYHQNKSIWVRTPGVKLWGDGARVHATNTQDQSFLMAANGASIYKFTLTAVTDKRGSTPWQSRIAIFSKVEQTEPLRDNIIRGNKIIASGEPGTAQANSATAAGIFIYRARGFLVADNLVSRSLSDGIHMSGGSFDGRVVGNTVRETGDDMISVVSYMTEDGWASESAKTTAAALNERKQLKLSQNILIANNFVTGQYWGRGISVVGGSYVTIKNNTIERNTTASAVYLAREASYHTFGVHHVRVQDNIIREVQTTKPLYTPAGFKEHSKTGQGAIEVYTQIFEDEKSITSLANELMIRDVAITGNTIENTISHGVRIGSSVGKSTATTLQTSMSGSTVQRDYHGWQVDAVTVKHNKMKQLGGDAVKVFRDPNNKITPSIFCANNTENGVEQKNPDCLRSQDLDVTGATIQ
jgi:hypothetical protein